MDATEVVAEDASSQVQAACDVLTFELDPFGC
jgi:hypothetical protein